MRLAIVGGKLQGIEAAFLAREAGWETLLIDRKPNPPAAGLCSSFCRCDVVTDPSALGRILRRADLILPAVENVKALRSLRHIANTLDVPLAYDADAYFISHSKRRSNRLFEAWGIPMPRNWPGCPLPLMAKPSASSGSRGVLRLDTQRALDALLRRAGPRLTGWVVQEYLEGPSYSIEVLGAPGRYEALQVTEIQVDDGFDCNRVLAPAQISASLERRIREIALTLAERLALNGIMDVEVILHQGVPKVLEIDARLPSQTPTAVYASTGINMLEGLRDLFVAGRAPRSAPKRRPRSVIYEHVRASRSGLEFPGEHCMGGAAGLEVIRDFFGADVAITNANASPLCWVATLVIAAENPSRARDRRERVIRSIRQHIERLTGRTSQAQAARAAETPVAGGI